MTTIQVTVFGKVALCRRQVLISSNEDYQLQFAFDSDWDDVQLKTARLVFDGQSYDIPFTGSTVALPRIPQCSELSVGVFSDTLASTMAVLGCIPSVADVDAEPVTAFTDSQYDQIVALLNQADLRQIDAITRNGNTLVFTFRDGSSMSVPLFDGTSIEHAQINVLGHLILTLTDGTSIDAGVVGGSGAGAAMDDAAFEAQFNRCIAALGTAEGGSY